VKLRIDLHIEELSLEGVAAGDRVRVAAALRSELAQQVLRSGLPARLDALAGRHLIVERPLALGHRVGPEAVGRAVAGGVWTTLQEGAR
jgi:hypothetical protein